MARGPETRLVTRVVEALRKEWPDCWTLKVQGNPYQSAGVPDLLVVVNGLLIGIEVKAQRPRESVEHALARVTLRQWASIEALRRAGATAGPALSVEDALALVRYALEGSEGSNAELSRPE